MPETRAVLRGLRRGWEISDEDFDRIYPPWARRLSDPHWTPLSVARRAVTLLTEDGGASTILDVGSGVGKLCHVGALTSAATFVGIEQRAGLVDVARDTATRLHADRALFLHGDMAALDWGEFDGFYLFNPFYEHVSAEHAPIDDSLTPSLNQYRRHVAATRFKLAQARPGARVVTYHGYGGPMPAGYRLAQSEPAGSDCLELWHKTR